MKMASKKSIDVVFFTSGGKPDLRWRFRTSKQTQDFHGFNRPILKEDANPISKGHQHINSPHNNKNVSTGDSAGDLFGMVKS